VNESVRLLLQREPDLYAELTTFLASPGYVWLIRCLMFIIVTLNVSLVLKSTTYVWLRNIVVPSSSKDALNVNLVSLQSFSPFNSLRGDVGRDGTFMNGPCSFAPWVHCRQLADVCFRAHDLSRIWTRNRAHLWYRKKCTYSEFQHIHLSKYLKHC
jgi:hypothetical protein